MGIERETDSNNNIVCRYLGKPSKYYDPCKESKKMGGWVGGRVGGTTWIDGMVIERETDYDAKVVIRCPPEAFKALWPMQRGSRWVDGIERVGRNGL